MTNNTHQPEDKKNKFQSTLLHISVPVVGTQPSETNRQVAKGHIRQANELRILAAAERVFAGAGYGGATMAAIADASGLPKANLHYYFGSKEQLYRTVLARTLKDWIFPIQNITSQAEPRESIEAYIRAKMALSEQRPHASKVFANELLHDAPVIKSLLTSELRDMVLEKVAVLQRWISEGRMAPVNPIHLFFTIWAATQTYADFDVQVCAVLGHTKMTEEDHAQATEHVVSLVLRGCGL